MPRNSAESSHLLNNVFLSSKHDMKYFSEWIWWRSFIFYTKTTEYHWKSNYSYGANYYWRKEPEFDFHYIERIYNSSCDQIFGFGILAEYLYIELDNICYDINFFVGRLKISSCPPWILKSINEIFVFELKLFSIWIVIFRNGWTVFQL